MTPRPPLEDVLFGPETGARLLTVHTGLAALIGVRILMGPYRKLAGTPDVLFDPVAILRWVHSMPSESVLGALQVVGVLAAIAAVLRRRPRLAFALAWACFLVLAGLRASRGKVQHNDLLLLWVAVPFLLAPVDVRWTDRQPRRDHGWPVRSGMVIAAVIYALSGYHKLATSGLDWAVGDNVRYVMLWGNPVTARWDGLSRWVSDTWWAYKGTGLFILTVELTFPAAVLWRRARPFYVASAVALHAVTYLLLGLDYSAWALVVLLLFVDWPALVTRRRRAAGGGSTLPPEGSMPAPPSPVARLVRMWGAGRPWRSPRRASWSPSASGAPRWAGPTSGTR